MSRSYPILALLILVSALISCSGAGNSPVDPGLPAPDTTMGRSPSFSSNAYLWGLWEVWIDPGSETFEAVPLRSATFTCNVVRHIDTPPGHLYFKNFVSETLPDRIDIRVDVGIEHPFPGKEVFIGFDVMGVFLGDVTGIYTGPEGFPVAGPDDMRMTNPDGYTRWFNAPEFTEAGLALPLFGYYPGAQGTPGFVPDGVLNPYRYYADDIEAEDQAFDFLINNSTDRGAFRCGSVNYRSYEITRPIATPARFQYAVVAHWEPNFNHPAPPANLDDFPISANADESIALSVIDTSSVYFSGPGDFGGTVELDISPWDWSATCSGVMEEYLIRCHSTAWDPGFDVDMNPVGQGFGFYTYHASIPVEMLTLDDPIPVWIEVSYPLLDYTNPSGIENDADGLLASYFLKDVPITGTAPFITVIIPNGGEEWVVGTNEEITWYSEGVVGGVNIEYSKDDFVSDVHLIVWNEENDFSFMWESIPNDPTTTARVRIGSTIVPSVFDVSDDTFSIIPADCEPEEHFEIEPNNTSGEANTLEWDYDPDTDGFLHTGQICPGSESDWYSLSVAVDGSQGSLLVICPDIGIGESLEVELYNESLELADSGSITEGDIAAAVRSTYHGDPQIYYLRVFSDDGKTHEYDIHPLRWPSWGEGLTFYETEPNDGSGSANAMAVDYDPDTDPFNYTGEQQGSDSDWFTFDTIQEGIILIHAVDCDNANNEAEDFTLYDGSLTQLDTGTIWYQDGNLVLSSGGLVASGTFYVEVSANTFTHRYVLEPVFIPQ